MTAFKFNQTELSPYHIVIIGSGPNSVYAMDRIAALCLGRPDLDNFHVHVFDRNGLFGCGEVHDINQPRSTLLNRIVSQISFGCNDDTPGCADFSSHVEVPVVEGGVYLIRVGGWREGSVGSGELSISLDGG